MFSVYSDHTGSSKGPSRPMIEILYFAQHNYGQARITLREDKPKSVDSAGALPRISYFYFVTDLSASFGS